MTERTAMTPEQMYDEIESLSWDVDGEFREDYSGRGMDGKECAGIVTDSPTSVIESAAERGIRGALTDSMGKRTIVYWPRAARPTR